MCYDILDPLHTDRIKYAECPCISIAPFLFVVDN